MKERTNERPWFKFFVSDWLDSETVRAMSIEERYSYITLLAHAWRTRKECSLPVSGADLAALTGIKKVSKRVLKQFPVVQTEFGPRRRNARLFLEWNSSFQFRSKQSQNAKNGWEKRKNGDGLALADVCDGEVEVEVEGEPEQQTEPNTEQDAKPGSVRWLVEAFEERNYGGKLKLRPKQRTALKEIIQTHGWEKAREAFMRFLREKPWNDETEWPAYLFIDNLETYL